MTRQWHACSSLVYIPSWLCSKKKGPVHGWRSFPIAIHEVPGQIHYVAIFEKPQSVVFCWQSLQVVFNELFFGLRLGSHSNLVGVEVLYVQGYPILWNELSRVGINVKRYGLELVGVLTKTYNIVGYGGPIGGVVAHPGTCRNEGKPSRFPRYV